ncbi:MAG TPA: MFS transporter [Sulfuriferula sp.]|nr:MFS transporter [Sulfuriferula sp.]
MSSKPSARAEFAPVRRREYWAWAMYDFANSGYTTVVITAVFSAYFVATIAGNAEWATFAWTAGLALSYLLIMLTGPALGAYADLHAAKKKLLAATTVGCVLFTAALALAGPGAVGLGLLLIVLSNFFYGSGENVIAAFLPELASGRDLGKVSGWGWSLGYMGGLLSLGCALAYITWAQGHGQDAAHYVPVTMLITAGLFALSSLPTFLWLRERAVPQPGRHTHLWRDTFSRLAHTLVHLRQYRDLTRFFVCIVFYQAGVQAVIALAAIYAQQAMHFQIQDTLKLILVVNITAAIGAFVFGYVQDRIGHIRTIALTLLGWIAMVLIAASAEGRDAFWVAANLAGLCMGASQSAGRALVGYLSPRARLAEFFGLWGFAVKLSSILGPVTYGVVTWVSSGDQRLAMLLTGSYFVFGLLILMGVNVRRGRRVVLRADRLKPA